MIARGIDDHFVFIEFLFTFSLRAINVYTVIPYMSGWL